MSGTFCPAPLPRTGVSLGSLPGLAAGVETPLGEFLGASMQEGWWQTLAGQANAMARRQAAQDAATLAGQQPLDEESWKASPHFREGLSFRPGVNEAGARVEAEIFDENRTRQALMTGRPGLGNTLLGFAAGIVGGIPTPENFIPIAGPALAAARSARFGLTLARAGAAVEAARAGGLAARAAAGFGLGGLEGAVGSLAVMPLTIPSRESFGGDVTFADIMLDLAFGAAAGGVVGGAVGAAFGRPGGNPLTPASGSAPDAMALPEGALPSPEVTDAVLRGLALAADQQARGLPVDLSLLPPEIRTALQTAQAEVARLRSMIGPGAAGPEAGKAARVASRAIAGGGEAVPGGTGAATTPTGTTVQVEYQVVELRELVASHDQAFAENPAFPPELQPRDRSQREYQDQVAKIAGELRPEEVAASPLAGSGAPIVGPDGVVESGNGRVLGIGRAYEQGLSTAEAYKAFLARQGFEVAGMSQPVLIRRRTTELDPDARHRFTRDANSEQVAQRTTAEVAAGDAERLTPGMLALLRGPNLASEANAPFVRAMVDALPQNERTAISTDGALTAEGLARLNRAVAARAYGERDFVALLTERLDSEVDTIGAALIEAAPAVARLRGLIEVGHPRQFGGAGDDSTDDTLALQRAADQAAAIGGFLDLGRGTWRISDTVTVPGGAAGVTMRGLIRYAGPSGRAALVIGDGGAAANRGKQYLGLRVERVTQADWTDEADIGIQLRNLDACFVEVLQAEGFTIGVQTFGDGRGFEDSTLKLGRLANNKIGLDVRTGQSTGWNNAVRYIGGHFANGSATHPLLDRFGVRFSRASGAYNLHNHHVFYGPAFELQNQGGAVAAIPFLTEVNSRSVVAHAIRVEGNSPTIARHTTGAQDHLYEVAFSSNGAITGTEGNAYLLEMDYPAGATRAGGTIVPLHQAAAVVHAPRLIAGAPSLRATAFRASATETGFEGMAVLAGNPAGPPTTLTGLAFRGLSSITLNADTVTLPTSRALGFVVDCSLCKDFALGFEGSKLRPTVMLFDASESVLDSSALPLASNQSLAWNGTAQWWQATADAEDASYTRLQRITVPAAAKYAVIGIGSSDAASVLKSLRLYAPEIHAPAVLAGGGRGWGTRELIGSASWDPPSVAAAGTTTTTVTVTGAAQGDQVQ
jgi:hypothetical protein